MTANRACVRGDLEEPVMARARRKRDSNADLVEAAEPLEPWPAAPDEEDA